MDKEILENIWIVLLVGLVIIGQIFGVAKKRNERGTRPIDTSPDPIIDIPEIKSEQLPKNQGLEQRMASQMISTPARNPKQQKRTEPTRAAQVPQQLADGFDLRKAVIYSEILKPKFHED